MANLKRICTNLKNLTEEFLKLIRLRVLEAIPIHTLILMETWQLILNYHIYEADALQITTCLHSQSNALISSDKKLIEAELRKKLVELCIKPSENLSKKKLKRG